MINLSVPLAVLASRLPRHQSEAAVAAKFVRQNRAGQTLESQDKFGTPRYCWVRVAATPGGPGCPFA